MHVAQNWRLNGQRYAMKGVRCENCQKYLFPPREVCPHCQARNAAAYQNEQPRIVSLPTSAIERAAR